MKFQVTKASDWDYKEEVEINTLEELVDFSKKDGIILEGNHIKIYDDYVE